MRFGACNEMSKYEWTRERTKLLISLWKELPHLWDASNDDYKNRFKRVSSLKELAQRFDADFREIVRKLHNLRTQYNNERRLLNKKMRMSKDIGKLYTSKWEFFESLKFVQSTLKCSENQSNIVPRDDNESEFTLEYIPEDISKKMNETSKFQKEEVYEKIPEIMIQRTIDDDAQIFGNFVASALRNLRSEEYRRKLKRRIQTAILEIEESDDANSSFISVSPSVVYR